MSLQMMSECYYISYRLNANDELERSTEFEQP